MKLETLVTLWQEKHASGNIWINAKKELCVIFSQDSKVYNYRMSIHGFAEKFNLIPDNSQDNWFVEADKAIEAMNNGVEFKSTHGLHDTIRYNLTNGTQKDAFLTWHEEKDIYDRILYVFEKYEIKQDEWLTD